MVYPGPGLANFYADEPQHGLVLGRMLERPRSRELCVPCRETLTEAEMRDVDPERHASERRAEDSGHRAPDPEHSNADRRLGDSEGPLKEARALCISG